MDEKETVFLKSVLSKVMESFTPHFQYSITKFDTEINNNNSKDIISGIFLVFPQNVPLYRTILNNLTDVSEAFPSISLVFICEQFSKVMKGDFSFFSAFQTIATSYRGSNESHCQILFNFATIFFSDWLLRIISKHGLSGQHTLIARVGLGLCDQANESKYVLNYVINQWTRIFSTISIHSMTILTQNISYYALECKSSRIFVLLSQIRLDTFPEDSEVFINDLFSVLKDLQKKKALSSLILQSVSQTISSVNFISSSLQKMVDIASAVCDDHQLKDGALDLLLTLYHRLPKYSNKIGLFMKKRVYAHANDEKKIERSLKLFKIHLFGGYSHCFSSNPVFDTSSMPNSVSEEFLYERENSHSLFMSIFFQKSNFSINPLLFRDVIVSLASIDFHRFITSVLSDFLRISFEDIRFITLLSCVPIINSEPFQIGSITPVMLSDIESFNEMIRGKIVSNIRSIKPKEWAHCVCLLEVIDMTKMQIDECDRKIAHYLEEHNIDKFGPLTISLERSEDFKDSFSLLVHVLKSFEFVFSERDFLIDGIIEYLIYYCVNPSIRIASSSLAVCRKMSKMESLQDPMIHTCVSLLKKETSQELSFICLSILLDLLSQNPKCINSDILQEIEVLSIIGLVSTQPITRAISEKLLNSVTVLMNNIGIFSYIASQKTTIEKCVIKKLNNCRKHSTLKLTTKELHEPILYSWVLLSHYYDVWLLFISEIINVIIFANYSPLLNRFESLLVHYVKKIRSDQMSSDPHAIGILLLHLSSFFHPETTLLGNVMYTLKQFEPLHLSKSISTNFMDVMKELMLSKDGWKDQIVFSVVEHSHYSIISHMIGLLSFCNSSQLQDASTSLISLLRSPFISDPISKQLLLPIISFLSKMQTYFISEDINSVRVLEWSPESEKKVFINKTTVQNYCTLISIFLNRPISLDELSITPREIIFRFLINWAYTTSPNLESIREYAQYALSIIVSAGPMFNESLLVDRQVIKVFTHIEESGSNVLSYLLFFHSELVLPMFLESCLTSSRSNSDMLFESLFVLFASDLNTYMSLHIGSLIFVGCVFKKLQHPRSKSYLESLVASIQPSIAQKVIDEMRNEGYMKTITSRFGYATEVVLGFGMSVLKSKSNHTPVFDIVESMRPWIKKVRLLPKQINCMQGIPSQYHLFTPYELLAELMNTTQMIDDDHFTSVASLWTDLLRSPDQSEFIPLFISDWKESTTKKKLFLHLIRVNALGIVDKLVSKCSFAYYFHITSQHKSFDDELWVVPLLASAIEMKTDSLLNNLSPIIHFALLFNAYPSAKPLLSVLCRQFCVPHPSDDNSSLFETSKVFVERIKEMSKEKLEMWGVECIKWLLGSQSLTFASISLRIFLEILVPIDQNVIDGIIKSITYHVSNNTDSPSCLSDLISDSFKFFNHIFTGNEMVSFSYAASFLDCTSLPSECLADSIDLFMKCLYSNHTRNSAWQSLVGIIRPLIPFLENNEKYQQIFDLLIKSSGSEELMMIVAPIKDLTPTLFPSVPQVSSLLKTVNQTAYCKAIEHYSLMVDSATHELSDSIFKLLSKIIEKASNENNFAYLSKLYQAAVNSLAHCPNSMAFLCSLAKYNPSVSIKGVFIFVDWARTIDDVCRSLARLVIYDDAQPSLTDCSTIKSVSGLLSCDVTPKILPFVTQQDMLEGMMKVKQNSRRKRAMSIRRTPSSNFSPRRSSGAYLSDAAELNFELNPIPTPTSLLDDSVLLRNSIASCFILTDMEFLDNTK